MTDDPSTDGPDAAERRAAVRDRYARVATGALCCSDDLESSCCGDDLESSCCGDDLESSCCSDDLESCCGDGAAATAERARELGYTEADLGAVDSAADLGLSCGNPTEVADLEAGEDVLDLGAGGGFDCFLAARTVGPAGRVVGVDATPEMVERARENAGRNDAANVEFRLGEMEHLPVADASVDVVVSNCAVNLSADKPQVFREAYRVLRPGGRLAVSDVVATRELPAYLRSDPAAVAACVGGAATVPAIEAMLTDAGFANVSVRPEADGVAPPHDGADESDPTDYVVPATIRGEKPAP